MGAGAQAHEVNPTIADISVENDVARLQFRLNAEAFLADIDLDGLVDTDGAETREAYDVLRAVSAADLSALIEAQSDRFLSGVTLSVAGVRVALNQTNVQVSEGVDPEFPRQTLVSYEAKVPMLARSMTLGWGKGYGTLILRQQGADDPYTGYLEGGDVSPEITISGGDALSGLQSFVAYIPVGFAHIIPMGLDHILFVLGLFFLSLKMRALFWQISAFTLAHTVTLAMGAMGWVVVPATIVEPLIAASIVYVAVENILSRGLTRWRPVVVFGFGLLHGLGFASVLGEFGLPQGQFVAALIGFNVGVELGQICVIILAYAAVGYWFGKRPWYRAWIAVPASGMIALTGAWWFVERVFA